MEENIEIKSVFNRNNNVHGNEDEDEDEIGGKDKTNASGNGNDDVGYESWNEGNYCWLLSNNTHTHASTKNKTTNTIRVRRRCTRTMKNTLQDIIYTQDQNER